MTKETFAKWQEWSKRDDACELFVPSDIRQMLTEIERLRSALSDVLDPVGRMKRGLEALGGSMNSMANHTALSITYAQKIARDALGDK